MDTVTTDATKSIRSTLPQAIKSVLPEEAARLERQFEVARQGIIKCMNGAKAPENAYSVAYQALVHAGLRQRLRDKYCR